VGPTPKEVKHADATTDLSAAVQCLWTLTLEPGSLAARARRGGTDVSQRVRASPTQIEPSFSPTGFV